MEEQKKEQKKLTYEELSQKFGELYTQYQKAVSHIQKLEQALSEDSLNKTSFFISMLFKVMEHPEMYDDDFTLWTKDNIQSAMRSFADAFMDGGEPQAENEKESDK